MIPGNDPAADNALRLELDSVPSVLTRSRTERTVGSPTVRVHDGCLKRTERRERRTIYRLTRSDLDVEVVHPTDVGWQLSTAPPMTGSRPRVNTPSSFSSRYTSISANAY